MVFVESLEVCNISQFGRHSIVISGASAVFCTAVFCVPLLYGCYQETRILVGDPKLITLNWNIIQ